MIVECEKILYSYMKFEDNMRKIIKLLTILIILAGCSKANKDDNHIIINEQVKDVKKEIIAKPKIKESNENVINESTKEKPPITNKDDEINIEVIWPEKSSDKFYIVKKDKELFLYNFNDNTYKQLTKTNKSIYTFEYSYIKNLLVFTVSIKNDYQKYFDQAESMNKHKVPTRLYIIDLNNKKLEKIIHLNDDSFVDNKEDYSWNKWVNQGIHIIGFDKLNSDIFYYNLNHLSYYSISQKKPTIISDEYNAYISNLNNSKKNLYATFANYEGIHQRLYDKSNSNFIENKLTKENPLTSFVGGSKMIGIINDNQIVIKRTPNDDMDFSGDIVIYDSSINEIVSEQHYNDIRKFSVLNNKLVTFIDPHNTNNGVLSGVSNNEKYKIWEVNEENISIIIDFDFLPDGYTINSENIEMLSDTIYKFFGRTSENKYAVFLFNYETKSFQEINDITGSKFTELNMSINVDS